MRRQGVVPSLRAYNSFIGACAKAKQAWSEAQREEASLEAMSAELQQTQQSITALQRGHGQVNHGQKAAETQRPADTAL